MKNKNIVGCCLLIQIFYFFYILTNIIGLSDLRKIKIHVLLLLVLSIDPHRGCVYHPSKFFAKLVNKSAIKHKKVHPPKRIITTTIYPPSQNLAKNSWTLPLDFQTMCIYGVDVKTPYRQYFRLRRKYNFTTNNGNSIL
jgi:hypothetical protein